MSTTPTETQPLRSVGNEVPKNESFAHRAPARPVNMPVQGLDLENNAAVVQHYWASRVAALKELLDN